MDSVRSHFLVNREPDSARYTPPSQSIKGKSPRPPEFRRNHGAKLKTALAIAVDDSLEGVDHSEIDTIRLEFRSFLGLELFVESLENYQGNSHVKLISIIKRTVLLDGEYGEVEVAVVEVPIIRLSWFVDRIESYMSSTDDKWSAATKFGESVADIRTQVFESLWLDDINKLPEANQATWYEIWWTRTDDVGRQSFTKSFSETPFRLFADVMQIGERLVGLAFGRRSDFESRLATFRYIGGFRLPVDNVSFVAELGPYDQQPFVKDLVSRIYPAASDSPVVTILDSGVDRNHQLLTQSLPKQDVKFARQEWKNRPNLPHGTEVAGIALFRDLRDLILHSDEIPLTHALESVKLYQSHNDTEPEFYGVVTGLAIDEAETPDAGRPRVFLLTVTDEGLDPYTTSDEDEASGIARLGEPSSWSAAIDELTYGKSLKSLEGSENFYSFENSDKLQPRLIIVAAGNIRNLEQDEDYLARCGKAPICDPGQSWNALTVGGYTKLDEIHWTSISTREDFKPIAKSGGLSPTSRTSETFARGWPIKPDVLSEGGNYAISPRGDIHSVPSLSLLTTSAQPTGLEAPITYIQDTSAAAAQAAHDAASILSIYPDFWPETVRGLLAHSAAWTNQMMASEKPRQLTKQELIRFMRRYGRGAVNFDRALQSATNDLVLIYQENMVPFAGSGRNKTFNECHYHSLPWPIASLAELDHEHVNLSVTLSYFIEPNPAPRGWKSRYRYQSHGFRFALNNPTEPADEFRERINATLRDLEAEQLYQGNTDWDFGKTVQGSQGSLITDHWSGTARDLAERSMLAVFPQVGWWKDSPRVEEERSARYSLIVGIQTDNEEVDLWADVQSQLAVEIET